jgi:hypothetical protein
MRTELELSWKRRVNALADLMANIRVYCGGYQKATLSPHFRHTLHTFVEYTALNRQA